MCVVFICLYVPLVSDLRSAMEYGRKGREEWWREKKNKKENEQERKRGRERELILARSRLFSPSLSCHFFFLKTTELGIWL